ncbi:metal-sensing transcriptional repressor [Gallaecimonas pentaromativorans]|uniref:DNA-binding FrmR family transcriptional regulator n=1 Tax=Gallaecimonas pentaromativorans TaxID=584787 RepID=A0A3N1PEW1_9GAMM|nr:metal-sensing transcriptional repressor [Gallaecimonas pentaromativorans]MED5524232.1 metal-sensing transcriptional repressor [Pseudomonadota bacterium]ROQ29992.1 DNA-binding FrmR family transcriptional regulator [Gallaecimonas pentaromativorans]
MSGTDLRESAMQPTPEQQDKMLKRLARVEGQIRGVQKLIREEADCEKVMQQLTASRKALDKAFFEMMACVIEGNVLDNGAADNAERMSEIRRLLTKYA